MPRSFLLLFFVLLHPFSLFAASLPSDLTQIGALLDSQKEPEKFVPQSRLDMKGASLLILRHPALKSPPVSTVIHHPLDIKNIQLRHYMSENDWKSMQTWAPDNKLVKSARQTPKYLLSQYVLSILGGAWGMFFASFLLAWAVYLGLQEKLTQAAVVCSFYLLWMSLPAIKYMTAWWLV